jgi:hypothetical protein
MAKGNPNSVAVQFKVHLKPTEVGALVMKRLERPHLDKSAELRRLIELGFAAEQAGFILDGTVLRNGGRVWDVKPSPTVILGTEAAIPLAPSPLVESTVGKVDSAVQSPGASVVADSGSSRSDGEIVGGRKPDLRTNLRRLSST